MSVMDRRFATVTPDLPIAQVRSELQAAPWGELFVIDETRRLLGTITFADLHDAAFSTSHDAEWTARDVTRDHPTALDVHEDLESAVKVFAASGEVHLPVVEDRESLLILLGIAHEHEVMAAYHRALVQARAEERGEA
jgi:CIC family chloride channel protein